MILVYSDDKRLMLELLAKAHELAQQQKDKVAAVLIGNNDETTAKDIIAYGADTVYIVDSIITNFKVEEYAEILEHIIKEEKVDLMLIGSNKNGKELAPRLAAKLGVGCSTDCTSIAIKDNHIFVDRIIYSGNAIVTEKFTKKPGIITVPSRAYEPRTKDATRTGNIIKKEVQPSQSTSKITKVQEMQTTGVNVEDADIIVSCGRGFKNKTDIKLVEELADVLKGKTVGCSRPIAADLKWLSEDHWIGLSGHKVKPKLYIATGISGQIQHIAGMRDSGLIVAINKDPDALIFRSADYGIVGDLYQVIPKLTQAIKEKLQ